MDYLEKLQVLIEEEQPSSFFSLWEEYCFNDVVRADELIQILEKIKGSSFAQLFGRIADTVLPLWERIPQGVEKDRVLILVLDVQNTNSRPFYDVALEYVERKFKEDENFYEALRVVGLRDGREFQYSLSHFELLMHFKEGNFVFHQGGWGVGEIMGVSFLQQKLLVEFEGVLTVKDVSFETAFKMLTALNKEHFLARRFGDPDVFERYAKEHPVEVVEILLRDLGPKTAKEIKDELVDLVIPEAEWNRWWQAAKTKIKKDTRILSPKIAKEPFVFEPNGFSLVAQLELNLSEACSCVEKLTHIYQFIRDLHSEVKKPESREVLIRELRKLDVSSHPALAVQRDLLLSEYLDEGERLDSSYFRSLSEEEIVEITYNITILALQKSFLMLVKQYSALWLGAFMKMFVATPQPNLCDALFRIMKSNEESRLALKEVLLKCAEKPDLHPELFVWFFLRLGTRDDGIFPLEDRETPRKFLESSFVLMHQLASSPHKDLGKKLHSFLVSQRYLVVRQIIEGASVAYLKEMLLLSTKCPQFSSSDLNILQSLAEVIQPDLKKHNTTFVEEDFLWTTAESFSRMKEKLQLLVGKEMIDNAKEIENARSLGDLRENSEYKFALERRARLQEEIRVLSEELSRARVLTQGAIYTDRVSVGCRVSLKDANQGVVTYTILGPWDAKPEECILSFKSKLAQEMLDKRIGETVQFQGKTYTIHAIHSTLD